MLGIFLKAGEQGGGFAADYEPCLMQRLALGVEAGDQVADALLVAAERPFEGSHLLVHDLFKLAGALRCAVDAAHQQVYFLPDRLGDRRKTFSGDILRPDEANGRVHQGFRHIAKLLGAVQEIGRGPRQRDRQEHGDQRRHQLRHVAGLAEHGRPIDRHAGENPYQRSCEGDPEGAQWTGGASVWRARQQCRARFRLPEFRAMAAARPGGCSRRSSSYPRSASRRLARLVLRGSTVFVAIHTTPSRTVAA